MLPAQFHPHTRVWRALALFVAVALAATLIQTGTGVAQAAPEDQVAAAEAAAAWIATEFASDEPDFDVFGKTAARNDVIYALAAAGTQQGTGRRALGDLAAGAAGYVGPPDDVNAGALAKVLLSVVIHGQDPARFIEDRDLESELKLAMAPSGSFAPDVFNHSLAMIALAATDAGVPAPAVAALVSLQCQAGDFTFMGTCPSDPQAPDIDTTAIALQALVAGGATQAASQAAAFLADAQNDDGSWPNPFGDPNANTAGVAGQAMRAAGQSAAADKAAEFVMTLQLESGGIRFTEADATANGFATLQGVLAMGAPGYWELTAAAFADVTGDSLFAQEIAWLGWVGVSRGCDPPANDNYCPQRPVTRGEMAAFLARALGLDDTGDAVFDDTEGSVFADDIAKIATADITRGCDPPTNDNYCPQRPVTRGEMAAFLARALGD